MPFGRHQHASFGPVLGLLVLHHRGAPSGDLLFSFGGKACRLGAGLAEDEFHGLLGVATQLGV